MKVNINISKKPKINLNFIIFISVFTGYIILLLNKQKNRIENLYIYEDDDDETFNIYKEEFYEE